MLKRLQNKDLKTQLQLVNDKYTDRIKLLVAQEIQGAAAKDLADSYREEAKILERISFFEKEIAEGRRFTEGDVNTQIDYNDALSTANNQLVNVKDNRNNINQSVQDAIALVTELGGIEETNNKGSEAAVETSREEYDLL